MGRFVVHGVSAGRRPPRWFIGCLALALMVGCAVARAAEPPGLCVLPELATDERPLPDGPPTTVEVGWGIVDVLDIDDVNQRLEGDFLLTLAWVDPRLEELEGCRFQRSRVWVPRVTLFNSFSLTARRANLLDQVVVETEGRVVYQQRYGSSISTYHPLRDFPFDRQAFLFRVGSVESGPDQLMLAPMSERTFLARRLNIEGWRVTGLETAAATEAVPALNAERSIFTATLEAERVSSYYVFKIVLPMGFIVMMSWAIFWVPPQRYEFQIGLGATSMLTLIAFQFSMSGYLPRLGYFTIADRLVVWATIMVFLAILNAIVTGVLVGADREATAVRVDRLSRWLFPLLLLLGWGSVLL
ncbi:hypothetical protein [Halomonas sp. SL1]|uniref:hypothetical protein n=1 Tax=Halomonas sp. SL1 TaxID=2137478 RepID=UPI0011B939EE|nr:hypothetical protein [Halomonas sp. SL1]